MVSMWDDGRRMIDFPWLSESASFLFVATQSGAGFTTWPAAHVLLGVGGRVFHTIRGTYEGAERLGGGGGGQNERRQM